MQSYKDRNPPWIRLHKKLLDDFEFQKMTVESRALLPMLWLLAAEDEDPVSGMLRFGYEEIAFRLRSDPLVIKNSVTEIIRAGFIEEVHNEEMPLFNDKTDSYGTVTEPLRNDHPETETETETESPLIPLKGENKDLDLYEKEKQDENKLRKRSRRNKKASYTDTLADAASKACDLVQKREES